MNWANRISLFRLLCIPAILTGIILHSPEMPGMGLAAGWVYIVAAISDFVDGYVARRFDQRTKLGALLDPLADKLLVNLTLVFLAVNPHFETPVPLWVPPLILSRDAIITLGAYLLNMYYGPLKPNPRMLGKISTVFQSIAISGLLLQVSFAQPLLNVMVVLAVVSLLDYVWSVTGHLRTREA